MHCGISKYRVVLRFIICRRSRRAFKNNYNITIPWESLPPQAPKVSVRHFLLFPFISLILVRNCYSTVDSNDLCSFFSFTPTMSVVEGRPESVPPASGASFGYYYLDSGSPTDIVQSSHFTRSSSCQLFGMVSTQFKARRNLTHAIYARGPHCHPSVSCRNWERQEEIRGRRY